MGKLIQWIKDVRQADTIRSLPENSVLMVRDGTISIVTAVEEGHPDHVSMEILANFIYLAGVKDGLEKGKKERAESVLTALRYLRRSVEESYQARNWSTYLRDAMERATVVLGRGY